MNEYELLYVISPRLSAEDAEGAIGRVGTLIEDAGGSISMLDRWGRRRLAYPIRGHYEGSYVLTHLRMPGERTAGFERALHISEDILRHLLVRGVIPGYEGPPEQEADTRRSAPRPPRDERPAPDAEAPPSAEAAPEPEPAPAAEAGTAPAPEADPAPAAEAMPEPEPAPAPAAEAGTAPSPEAEPVAAAGASAPAADAPADG